VLTRKAVVYVRQSTPTQVRDNLESQRRQYHLVDVARQHGFAQVDVIDDDLGLSAGGMVARPGFERLVAWLCAGEVGAVLCFEASRVARNGRDWHHLLDLCGLVKARVIDQDGIYDPRHPNDRLLLGMKGQISEFELGVLRARMLDAGEDPRFIARRIVILASEDIRMADSTALLVAEAAARAVEYVGLPEAQLNLAHAVVRLATAPKSNRVTVALSRAKADARSAGAGEVPIHLRDAHYKGAASLGHGQGYVYPHDDPSGWVPQQHRPDEVAGNVYWEPSEHGRERDLRPAGPAEQSGEPAAD